jgi:hypothetical protein
VIRRLVAGQSRRGTEIDVWSIYVESVAGKLALGMEFIRILRFLPDILRPPMLHTKTLIICHLLYIDQMLKSDKLNFALEEAMKAHRVVEVKVLFL